MNLLTSNAVCVNQNGMNALHFAITHGNTDAAKYLIDKGIDIYAPDEVRRWQFRKIYLIILICY